MKLPNINVVFSCCSCSRCLQDSTLHRRNEMFRHAHVCYHYLCLGPFQGVGGGFYILLLTLLSKTKGIGILGVLQEERKRARDWLIGERDFENPINLKPHFLLLPSFFHLQNIKIRNERTQNNHLHMHILEVFFSSSCYIKKIIYTKLVTKKLLSPHTFFFISFHCHFHKTCFLFLWPPWRITLTSKSLSNFSPITISTSPPFH